MFSAVETFTKFIFLVIFSASVLNGNNEDDLKCKDSVQVQVPITLNIDTDLHGTPKTEINQPRIGENLDTLRLSKTKLKTRALKTFVSNSLKKVKSYCSGRCQGSQKRSSSFGQGTSQNGWSRKNSRPSFNNKNQRSPLSPPPWSLSPKRKLDTKKWGNTVADNIRNIVVIPSGEFSYDTKVQLKSPNFDLNQQFSLETAQKINQNSKSAWSDAVLSLDQMREDLPNVSWISVVVYWYASSTNICDCVLYPAVEFRNKYVMAEEWQVGEFNRENARLISRDIGGKGTVSDAALIRYVEKLHHRGYNVMLYPKLLLGTENTKWRGGLTGPWSCISQFFSQYKNVFMNHYAKIAVKTKVEGFIIGSGMTLLTGLKDSQGNYPVITELLSLAEEVKSRLGTTVTVTYAADWTEYHSHDGWYFMDALWASKYIDVVGINGYFPLTDGPEPPGGYSVQDVVEGWTKGEGYDYFWNYAAPRPVKTRFSHCKLAWKNIEKWWSEAHINPDGSQTAWRPKMKKIWFTEYGFPSVDGCTNQPDVFVRGRESSVYPRYSYKYASFRSQKVAIEGFLKKWWDSEMVERMFLWAWDARPYPAFPDSRDVWDDGRYWKTNFWIQGKIGNEWGTGQSVSGRASPKRISGSP